MQIDDAPIITIDEQSALAKGVWQVHALCESGSAKSLNRTLKALRPKAASLAWDLSQVTALDHIGAQMFWNTWGKQRPASLKLAQGQEELFARIEKNTTELAPPRTGRFNWVMKLGFAVMTFGEHVLGMTRLVGGLVQDLGRFARRPMQGPWREISANIYHAGFEALGITALVGALIGVVLSYLSAQQLRTFGGDMYIVNILGMSVIRELGPLLAAILVAGRSGSAITAQLGVMRVTEELDAMLVMGISHGFRLILPKVIALAISMPLLVIWTDAMAILGGMVSAKFELGLSMRYFLEKLPGAVPLVNYHIGLIKGVTFGMLIGLVACHFGLRIKPNTESLGIGTTTSVVSAITIVIIADAIFAIIFSGKGYS